MSRPTPATYKTRNWPAYNEALKRRGSLTIWFDPEMIWEAVPSGRRGRQQTYGDAAIQTCLSMKVLFGMALRQTTGFVESLLRLAGLDWTVPDFSTLRQPSRDHATHNPAGQRMHCMKLLGQRLMARDFDRQVAEVQLRIAILNGYTALGIPVTKAAG